MNAATPAPAEAQQRAVVANYGPSGYFATCLGNLWIPRGAQITITNSRAIAELKRFPRLEITLQADYSQLSINELRRLLAGKAGVRIQGNKQTLLKLLEVNHGKT